MNGKVKWYNFRKGYGFIQGDDNEDYFVHFTAIPKGVKIFENDTVSFDASENEKGKQATNLKLVESAPREERKSRRDSDETLEDDETESDVQDDAEDVAEDSDKN